MISKATPLVRVQSVLSRSFTSTAVLSDKIGFVGLGNMGGHMANNLLAKGHDLTVFDLSKEAVGKAVANGASEAATVADVAKDADAIVTMLPSSPHVKEVYEGALLEAASPGTLMMDCSTIDPNVAKSVAQSASAAGMKMVDAPVSGGVGGAEAGTLTFMVGGASDDFESAKVYLADMGANIVHCGDNSMGQVAKLCNNLLLGISMTGACEAFNLGVKMGMDPKLLAGIINTSSGRCWSTDTYNPCPGVMEGVPSSRGYTGGFGAALMLKDLGLANDAAKSVNAPLPTGMVAHSLYTAMTANGAGGKDFSAMYELLAGNLDSITEE